MESVKTFKDLDIWKRSIQLVKEIYRASSLFPSNELYGLTAQMRRSAISIPSNIAEGCRRRGPKEFARFLNIALSSLAELETQLIIADELSYLEKDDSLVLFELIDHISRMVFNLRKKL
jgi:four helix bundle protein